MRECGLFIPNSISSKNKFNIRILELFHRLVFCFLIHIESVFHFRCQLCYLLFIYLFFCFAFLGLGFWSDLDEWLCCAVQLDRLWLIHPALEEMGKSWRNNNDFWTLAMCGSYRKQSWSHWAGRYLRSLVNLIIKHEFEYRTSWGSGLHGRKRTGQTQIIEHNAESDMWITIWIKVREQNTGSQWPKGAGERAGI